MLLYLETHIVLKYNSLASEIQQQKSEEPI